MKNYLDLLQDIVDNGKNVVDRTRVGRRRVFGRQLRFDLSQGKLPLLTTKKVFLRGIIEELLWFIRGSADVKELIDKNVHIWDEWMLTREDVDKYAHENKLSPREVTELVECIGSIGPIYGSSWRNIYSNAPQLVKLNTLASDKLEQVDALIKGLGDNKHVTYQGVANQMFGSVIDQLQTLMINLKERPYSSRHVISTWIPENIPDETKSPQVNVIEGKGALAPCHVLQQYFVEPPLVEGGKKRLSLMMTQR